MNQQSKITVIILALSLFFISLWQLEIIFVDEIWQYHGYCFPFDLYCTEKFWVVRDFYFALLFIAFFLLIFYILTSKDDQ